MIIIVVCTLLFLLESIRLLLARRAEPEFYRKRITYMMFCVIMIIILFIENHCEVFL